MSSGGAAKPLRKVELAKGAEGRCLVVLLPGRWSRPERFERAGFAAAVAQRRLALDLVAVDANLGYYQDGSIVARLHDDVVAPARAAGYRTIWLAGTSLGGLGALLYLHDHPDEIDGVVALAPFLGDPELIAEIEAAGGPETWQPPARSDLGDPGRKLWIWLATWTKSPPAMPVEIGWGNADPLAPSNRLLARLLPREQSDSVPGAHDWKTWTRLWERFLDRAAPCGASRSGD